MPAQLILQCAPQPRRARCPHTHANIIKADDTEARTKEVVAGDCGAAGEDDHESQPHEEVCSQEAADDGRSVSGVIGAEEEDDGGDGGEGKAQLLPHGHAPIRYDEHDPIRYSSRYGLEAGNLSQN